MKVRAFRRGDADAVVALWERCGLTRSWNDPRQDIDRKLAIADDGFLVGEIDGTVVASVMVGYDGHRGWVNYLGVDPDVEGEGYGRAIMAAAESWLVARGCPKLNLQVRSTNAGAMAFYDSLGFIRDDVVSYGKRLIDDD